MSHLSSPTNPRVSIDAFGSVLLTAIMFVALAISTAQYAKVSGIAGPDAVSRAFAATTANG